jgi:hypothetical protein
MFNQVQYFPGLLLDPSPVRSVLGAAVVPRSELLEVVRGARLHLRR